MTRREQQAERVRHQQECAERTAFVARDAYDVFLGFSDDWPSMVDRAGHDAHLAQRRSAFVSDLARTMYQETYG